jgi:polyisoprenoid-binding protein YceI
MDAPSVFRLGAGSAAVSFRVKWFGIVTVRGRFASVGGAVRVPCNGEGVAEVTVEVMSESVRTGIGLRDRHLRGSRFLDSERDPFIRFKSDRVRRHDGAWDLQGRLALRGQTHAVTASVLDQPSSDGNRRLAADFSVPRRPHAIGTASGIRRLNPLLWAIGDDVTIHVELVVPATLLQQVAEHVPAR